jgi:hypothetical protein
MNFAALIGALREAVVAMLAVIATLLCALALDPRPAPAILAVVLSLALSRSHLDRSSRERLEAAVALPAVGLLTVGVGFLLLRAPWLGALVFTTGIAGSLWLRRFGPTAGRIGSLIALPFVAILTTPHLPHAHSDTLFAWLEPVAIALLALFWVASFHFAAHRVGWIEPAPNERSAMPVREAGQDPRLDAPTRMALQMATALAVSFAVGFVFFPERWSWIVLTAFIVNSGNCGRLDVAYKSVLRVIGAAAGTAVALAFALHLGGRDTTTVLLMLAAVFLGTWLRPFGYAWWALFVTLALALLQGFTGLPMRHILWPRLEEIVIGAAIGVASAWLVFPVRSTGVLRRRIADALAALSEALDPKTELRTSRAFVAALARVEQVAPAFRASRFATRTFAKSGSSIPQPADWIDVLLNCRPRAVALIDEGTMPADVRVSVGKARKALREPATLLAALRDLSLVLDQNAAGGSPAPLSDP